MFHLNCLELGKERYNEIIKALRQILTDLTNEDQETITKTFRRFDKSLNLPVNQKKIKTLTEKHYHLQNVYHITIKRKKNVYCIILIINKRPFKYIFISCRPAKNLRRLKTFVG